MLSGDIIQYSSTKILTAQLER